MSEMMEREREYRRQLEQEYDQLFCKVLGIDPNRPLQDVEGLIRPVRFTPEERYQLHEKLRENSITMSMEEWERDPLRLRIATLRGLSKAPLAVLYADGRLLAGDNKATLEDERHDVLTALAWCQTCSEKKLQNESGQPNARKLLARTVEDLPFLNAFITFPGGRGKGGYSTTITLDPAYAELLADKPRNSTELPS